MAHGAPGADKLGEWDELQDDRTLLADRFLLAGTAIR
jgi:hypothetical protein